MNLILLLLMFVLGYAYTGRSTSRHCTERNGVRKCVERTTKIDGNHQTMTENVNFEARGNPNLDNLIRQAIGIINTFKNQENNVYGIVIKNREISGKLDRFIGSFPAQAILRNNEATIKTLTDAENFFRETENYIGQLTREEQQLNSLIQKIIELQGKGNTISNEIKNELQHFEQNQPFHGMYQITSNAAPMYHFHGVQHLPVQFIRPNFRQTWWRSHWRSKRQAFVNFTPIQQFHQQDPAQDAIQFILSKLKGTLTNAVKYRMFLTALSHAFKNVKVYSQRLISDLEELSEYHKAGLSLDSGMYSVNRLKNYWSEAKRQPAIQITLMLNNINDSHATLSSITNRDWQSSAS